MNHQQHIHNKVLTFQAWKTNQKRSTNRINKQTQSENNLLIYAHKKLKKILSKKVMMIQSWKTKKKTPTKLKEEHRQYLRRPLIET